MASNTKRSSKTANLSCGDIMAKFHMGFEEFMQGHYSVKFGDDTI